MKKITCSKKLKSESADDAQDRYQYVKSGEFVVVEDIRTTAEMASDKLKHAYLNFGVPGKIYGQVNDVFEEDGLCIMTLAPYKNSSRQSDCSIPGHDGDPLRIDEILELIAQVRPDVVVAVRYKDPLAFGPRIGQIIQSFSMYVQIDNVMGLFLRKDNSSQPKVISAGKPLSISESSDDKKIDAKNANAAAQRALKATSKNINDADDVRKFLNKNQAKLDKLSKKLPEKDRKNLQVIIDALKQCSSTLNESKFKIGKNHVIHGMIAILCWLLTMSPFIGFMVAFAPQASKLLAYAADKAVDLTKWTKNKLSGKKKAKPAHKKPAPKKLAPKKSK